MENFIGGLGLFCLIAFITTGLVNLFFGLALPRKNNLISKMSQKKTNKK